MKFNDHITPSTVPRVVFGLFLIFIMPFILLSWDMNRWEKNNEQQLSLLDEKLRKEVIEQKENEHFSAQNLYLTVVVFYPTATALVLMYEFKRLLIKSLQKGIRLRHPFKVARILFLGFAYAALSVQAVTELRDHLHVDVLHNMMNLAIFLIVVILACPLAISLIYKSHVIIYVATISPAPSRFLSSVIFGLINEYMHHTVLPSLSGATLFAFSFKQTALLLHFAYLTPYSRADISYQEKLLPIKLIVVQFMSFTYRDLVNHHYYFMAGVLFLPVIFGIFALFYDVKRVRKRYNSGSKAAATPSPNDRSKNDVGADV